MRKGLPVVVVWCHHSTWLPLDFHLSYNLHVHALSDEIVGFRKPNLLLVMSSRAANQECNCMSRMLCRFYDCDGSATNGCEVQAPANTLIECKPGGGYTITGCASGCVGVRMFG
jgi:hypothetical protein